MAFSVSKSHPFRSLGLYRSTGKHAAPKGKAAAPRRAAAGADGTASTPHRPAHAAAMPRQAGSPAGVKVTRPQDAVPAGNQTPAEDQVSAGNRETAG